MTAMRVAEPQTRHGLPVLDSVDHVYNEYSDDLLPESNFAAHHGPALREALRTLLAERLTQEWRRRGYPSVVFMDSTTFVTLVNPDAHSSSEKFVIATAFEQFDVWRAVVDAITWEHVLTAASLRDEYHGFVRSSVDYYF